MPGALKRMKKSENLQDIPWKQLISYHQEITRRSEEKFFSLYRKQEEPSDQWCFLSDEQMRDLWGPWSVPLDEIDSPGLLQKIRMEEVRELYLGGPLWIQNRNTYKNNWLPHVHPFFLKEVAFENAGDRLELEALPGEWEISPLAFKGLERSEVLPEEDAEEILRKILEETAELPGGTRLSRWIRQEILERLPVFSVFFNNQDASALRYRPGAWVLFTPGETGPISRYLLNDYIELQNQVGMGKLGGLSLLGGFSLKAGEGGESKDGEGMEQGDTERLVGEEVLPIVPLNESQEEAVRGILKHNPVTVISGPPGCGKSQVVVSAILNAWSRGLSVLFASNNNQAVDVVKERLAPFEKYTPIAVRAGSSQKSSLESDLTTIRAHIISLAMKKPSEGRETRKAVKELLSLRRRLHEFLDSKLPEQIEQGIQAALKAYGSYLKTGEDLEAKKEGFLQRKADLGLSGLDEEALGELVERTQGWEKTGDRLFDELRKQREEIAGLEADVGKKQEEMLKLLTDLGVDTEKYDDWSWLLSNEGPGGHKAWLEDTLSFFEGGPGNRLREIEWKKEWDFWTSSHSCEIWAEEAERHILEIQNLIADAEPVAKEIEGLEKEYRRLSGRLAEFGFSDNWRCDRSIVDRWNAGYARFITSEKTFFSRLPFSGRSLAVRAMRGAEKELRITVPLGVWRRIGRIDESGRNTLSEILELAAEYLGVQERRRSYSEKREALEEAFSDLRRAVVSSGMDRAPGGTELAAWRALTGDIRKRIDLAGFAKKAWLLREDREKVLGDILSLCARFAGMDAGFPLKKAWLNGEGRDFARSLDRLEELVRREEHEGPEKHNRLGGPGGHAGPERHEGNKVHEGRGEPPIVEAVDDFRTRLYSGKLRTFLTTWERVRDLKQRADEIHGRIRGYPPEEDFLNSWLKEKPDSLPASPFTDLPGEESESRQWLRRLVELDGDVKNFHALEEPRIMEQLEEEYQWAKKNLRQVFDLVPGIDEKEDLGSLYSSVFENSAREWPVQELLERFRRYDTRWIGSRIEMVDRQLRDITFEQARREWENRVSGDSDLPDALQSLLSYYRRNRKNLKADGFELFKKVLSAIPVWITTAQSPQSIPMIDNVFDLVIIDEATQCTLTNLFPLIYRGKRLVVIGDPEQLPAIPSISSGSERPLAMKFGVLDWLESFGHDNNTVYSAAARCLPGKHADIVLLREHYRSHPLIIGFSNLNIYQSLLKLRRNPAGLYPDVLPEGVSLVPVAGRAVRGSNKRSWVNRREAEKVLEYLEDLYTRLDRRKLSVGIVTPFRAQKDLLVDLIDRSDLPGGITVGTAHAFQGDERDVMLFSPVAGPGISPESVNWIEEPRNLVNVAVTRARESLVLVGNIEFLVQRSGIIGKLATYIMKVEALRKMGSEELRLYSWMVLSGWNPEVLETVGEDKVTFVLKEAGIRLAVVLDGGGAGLEERLAGRGFKTQVVERRAVVETPALVLKSLADQLKQDYTELLELLPETMRTGDTFERKDDVPSTA